MGGTYKPDFGWDHLSYNKPISPLNFKQAQNGWTAIMDYMKSKPINEKGVSTIKRMKAMTRMLKFINESKHKDIIMGNENILKCFVQEKLILKELPGF